MADDDDEEKGKEGALKRDAGSLFAGVVLLLFVGFMIVFLSSYIP